MPSKHSKKPYLPDCYYHVYNRGVEKRDIFLDDADYETFLSFLSEYLSPKATNELTTQLLNPSLYAYEKAAIRNKLKRNNFANQLQLLSYCFMPNHFHLLIKQTEASSIDTFMNSLATRYTMYFNRKYKRVGPLYQGVYKAAPLTSMKQVLFLSRYIHKQAYRTQPCSYSAYNQASTTPWIQTNEVLTYFATLYPKLSYDAFIKTADEHLTIPSFPTLED